MVIVHDTYKLLKSRRGWRIRLDDGPASRPQTAPQKTGAHQAGTQYRSVPPSIRKINSIEANRGERPEFRS
jgi:hypothetical protein